MSQPARARNRVDSFRHAFAGLGHVLRSQQNARLHALASLIVLLIGLWLRVDRQSWVTLILAMALVWVTEILNTALEAIVDLVSPELHPLAKVAKDAGAAAVLISAIGAALVGFLVLGPPLGARLFGP
ncbi:MAG TPA: diacylglycerol kinase family protein [Anaerolineales bacterium]